MSRGSRRADRRGAFVVVVGPDGAGKTTAARALIRAHPGPTAYFHYRPGLLAPMEADPPVHPEERSKEGPGGSRPMGWVRLGLSLVRFWAAYTVRIVPALWAGKLVVGDRWCFGYLTQPVPLGFFGPPWLAAAAVATLPRPHLLANLVATPQIIHARKRELSLDEISAELLAWQRAAPRRRCDFDATLAPDALGGAILAELRRRRPGASIP